MRNRRTCRAAISDAAREVAQYRDNIRRDIYHAEEIWNRIDDPGCIPKRALCAVAMNKAIRYAKKRWNFADVSKKYVAPPGRRNSWGQTRG